MEPRETNATIRARLIPVLATIALTVLLLWLIGTAADIFLLLFVAILFSLFLGAVTDAIVARTGMPRGIAFAIAFALSIGGVVALVTLLIPPVAEQTRQLAGNLPRYVAAWQGWFERMLETYPALKPLWADESGKIVGNLVEQAEGALGDVLPRVVGLGHVVVNIVSIVVMSVFLAVRPANYREWLIAMFPPVRRGMVRDVLGDLSRTLRQWIVAQLLAMMILAVLTAIGLYLLDVPYWLTFGVFTGAVAIVPFFGTLISSVLPALFVLGGDGFAGFDPGTHALMVMALGFVIHVVEANLVVPLLTQAKVEIPPVLSMMSVLIVGRLLGPAGLVIAVPLLAVCIVLVKRVLIQEVYGVDALPEVFVPATAGGATAELQVRPEASTEAGAGAT